MINTNEDLSHDNDQPETRLNWKKQRKSDVLIKQTLDHRSGWKPKIRNDDQGYLQCKYEMQMAGLDHPFNEKMIKAMIIFSLRFQPPPEA
ncbi:hypothetical protein C9I98_18385 [Photobacterium sanctipauli]|uniref:Uncharacterized protein n=1 Tax=Photobacterium sanctipauli TaxID=1342794 RepID=A0A2T3NP80_9GAMM|nr:hypothetical protein C9I98_18385 [Photobacterium sanctipauli]